jgi:hypothetical protein
MRKTAFMAYPLNPAFKTAPSKSHRRFNSIFGHAVLVGRPKRIVRQEVFDISKDQLLMLLLVINSKLHQFSHTRAERCALDSGDKMTVDMPAVVEHFVKSWTSQQTALGTGVLLADRLIVRVEHHAE